MLDTSSKNASNEDSVLHYIFVSNKFTQNWGWKIYNKEHY